MDEPTPHGPWAFLSGGRERVNTGVRGVKSSPVTGGVGQT
jgi:hypothetical protein